jgi:hypothetical protein
MGANHVQISQETRKRPRLVESMGRSSNHPVKNRSPSLYVCGWCSDMARMGYCEK